MRAKRTKRLVGWALPTVVVSGLVAASAIAAGCNSIVGLDQFSIGQPAQSGGAAGTGSPTTSGGTSGAAGGGGSGGAGGQEVDAGSDAPPPECVTNRECTDRATAAAMARAEEAGPGDGSAGDGGGVPMIDGKVPAMCLKPEGKCVELLSEDCKAITGVENYLNDNAVLLGTLFTITGAQGATNLQRQQSATLAFEEVNSKGGLPPSGTSGVRRPIVVLSCNEIPNLARVGNHMINELHIPAIVGPNTSQDTITLSNTISATGVTIGTIGGTVLMTPSAVASSIAELDDNDLTWLMAPSDVQRAPLMIKQINDIEMQFRGPPRNRTNVKLGIIYRDDALGQGTRTALVPMSINGKSLTDPANMSYVSIDPYPPTATAMTLGALHTKYRDFAPDIIALAGTAEAITAVMSPIEAAWSSEAGADRPYYVTIDSAKVPELLTAAANPDLRSRVRGTGITPTAESVPVLSAFQIAYTARYSTPTVQNRPTASSTGPSYDAAYAIAYALAATKDLPVTGKNVAAGLRKLAGGPTVIEVGSTKILAAFQRLAANEKIATVGTFGPLDWDPNGAVVSATLEMWCVGAPNNTAAYLASGLTYDLKTKVYSGTYTPCQ